MNSRVSVSCVLVLVAAASPAAAVRAAEPTGADELFAEARALSTREDWSGAIERFRRFLREHPGDPRAHEAQFWIGFSLVKDGEYNEAVRELRPFESEWSGDRWADDALLQLGHAYRGLDDDDRALASWKLLLEKHPDSVWRIEAALQIIDLLFHGPKDYAACLPYCERVVRETADFDVNTEARYAGAYCLNALGRHDEADRWMDRWFTPDDAVEAGWRRVLGAQRDLRQGRADQALRSLGAIDADFPDLDQGDRVDLTLRAAAMLASEKQSDRARDLLVEALKRSAGDSEEEITGLLDQLEEAIGDDDGFRIALERLAGEPSLPIMARMAVRDRRVRNLRDGEHADQAEALLREALAGEKAEYARFRAATLLAEWLQDDRDDRAGAVKVLEDILPGLRRGDLAHQVRKAIGELRSSSDAGREQP